ncbi:hypothetical protein ACFXJ8_03320 [Nonomuraea sp. NPDC059194]|uniref:hypothetical protein n=1 Tax=Nonomuraea sp. NPDC059194 TaxID=3346764 RepID=UPI003691D2B4
MAHLLDTLDDEVPITYGQFMLRGVSGLQGVDTRVHLAELDRQIYLYASAEHSRVRVEVWDGPPPPWEGHGKLVADARCVAETGVVAVTPYMFAGSGRSVLIGPAFFEYGLHLYAHNAERLLRFWPIRDVFDPALHLRPDGVDADAKPVETVEARSTLGDWVSTRVLGSSLPPASPASPKAEEDWPLDHEHEVRLAELLGDLRTRLMTRPPTWLLDTDEGNRSRYLNELRSSVATARRLNPDGLPTFQLSFGELVERPQPGLSYRLWQWRPILPPADAASAGPGFPDREGVAAPGKERDETGHTRTDRAETHRALADPTVTDPTVTDPTVTDPTVTDPTVTDPTGIQPIGTEPVGAERHGTVSAATAAVTATAELAPPEPEPAETTPAVTTPVETTPVVTTLAGAPETLTAEREVRALDALRRRMLVTGIVTVLREENGVVEARDAVPAEVTRVLAAERAWALD